MRDEGDLHWFLGIRVIRDREHRQISLCQDSHIEKIATKFDAGAGRASFPSIPIPVSPLAKYRGTATAQSIKAYQEKVGSILYAAVITRHDVARAASELSRHLTNPSPDHHKAAEQTIAYLYSTRCLAATYGSESTEALVICSDASFADDEESRKSSQGYFMTLFGGPAVWKASRQSTVTTSTTEAELRALQTTASEAIALERLLKSIALDLQEPLKLYCDNTQTIRLVISDEDQHQARAR